MSSRRRDFMAIDMGRLKNKDNTTLPIVWERDASRKDLKGFTIAAKKIPYFVNLKSALIELKKSASRWTRTRRRISPIEWRKMSTFDIKKNWWISLNKSGKNWTHERSFWLQRSVEYRLCQDSGEEQIAPIPFWQYQQWHPSSFSSSTSWWQWNDYWWSSW